jgi:hypothetical protein
MALEYLMYGEMFHKSNVYRFGVIVLEILTGRRNKDGLLLIKSVNVFSDLYSECVMCDMLILCVDA